jgi:hypothetical protein
MKPVWWMIVGAAMFAIAMLVSSWLIADRTIGDWAQAIIGVAATCYLSAWGFLAVKKQRG